MPRLITHVDVSAVADGGTLYLEPDAGVTPLAQERAAARGISLQRGAAPEHQMLHEVARQVVSRLSPEIVQRQGADRVVAEVLAALQEGGSPQASSAPLEYCAALLEQERRRARKRAIITTTGRNTKGIVARLTGAIADMDGDVLDISQTLVAEYFTMLLVVDTAALNTTFAAFKATLEGIARELSIQVLIMHEDLVSSLHRT